LIRNYSWKLIKTYWWLLLISFPVWFALIWGWNYFGILQWLKKIGLETLLSLGFSLATAAIAKLINRQKESQARFDADLEILRGIIAFNNEAMKDTSRRLEDSIDSVMLELRRLDAFTVAVAEVRSQVDATKDDLCSIVAEQERQKERLQQGDRLLYAIDLIAECIKETERLKCEVNQLKYWFNQKKQP